MQHLIYSNCRQDRVMNKKMERVSVRELFSELFETPINPMLIHVVPPFVNEDSPIVFIRRCDLEMARDLQLSGDSVRLTPTDHLASWL